jgi:RND family efflux transporter MFP subunit
MKRIIIAVLLAVILLGGATFKLYSNKQTINKEAAFKERIADVPVSVEAVIHRSELSENDENTFVGTFQPFEEVDITAEAQGKLVAVYVQEGNSVKAGQPLAKIDDELLKIKSQAEEAAFNKAKLDLERFENLNKENATTDVNIQNVRMGYKAAEAQYKATQEQIKRTSINAPIGGVLTRKTFDKGEVVAPGPPLGTITDISRLKLVVMMPENRINTLRTGQKIGVTADIQPANIINGAVSLIAAKSDMAHNYKIEVLVPNNGNPPLKAGMYGRFSLRDNAATSVNPQSLIIPRHALVGSIKDASVFVEQNGKAVLRSVRLGSAVGGNFIEVASGIQHGERVITSGLLNLENGMTVSVQHQQ